LAAESESLAKPLAANTRRTDTILISTWSASGKKEIKFSDKKWIERLAKVLESSSYRRLEPMGAMPADYIALFQSEINTESLGIYNDDQLIVSTGGKLLGVFSIGAEIHKAIVDLLNEKKN
jgi:hypothetical protein